MRKPIGTASRPEQACLNRSVPLRDCIELLYLNLGRLGRSTMCQLRRGITSAAWLHVTTKHKSAALGFVTLHTDPACFAMKMGAALEQLALPRPCACI